MLPCGVPPLGQAPAASALDGESMITFRHYGDLKDEEVTKPKFWCHYGCPQQQQQQQEQQLIEEQGQGQQGKQSQCYGVIRQAQGDSNLISSVMQQQVQQQKPLKSSAISSTALVKDSCQCQPEGGCIGTERRKEGDTCGLVAENHDCPDKSRQQRMETDQRKVRITRSQNSLMSEHRSRLAQPTSASSSKADQTTSNGADDVTIDNFREVMCLDTAAAKLSEDSDDIVIASDSITTSSNDDSVSSHDEKAERNLGRKSSISRWYISPRQKLAFDDSTIPGRRRETKNTKLKTSGDNGFQTGLNSGNKRNTKQKSNIERFKENDSQNKYGNLFARKTSPSKITEMNTLANALFRKPFVSSKEYNEAMHLDLERNEARFRRNAKGMVTNDDGRHRQSPSHHKQSFDQHDGRPASRKCRFEDISDGSYFKREVRNSLQQINTVSNSQTRLQATQLIARRSEPLVDKHASSPKSSSGKLQFPSPAMSRRLVVTDQVYGEPSLCPVSRGLHSSKQPKQGYQNIKSRKMRRNKDPHSLNNSQTRDNGQCLENFRFVMKRWAKARHIFRHHHIEFPKSLKLSAFKDKDRHGRGKSFPDITWHKATEEKKNFKFDETPFNERGKQIQDIDLFNCLDARSPLSIGFPGLIPKGASLVELMRKGLKDIRKLHKRKKLSTYLKNPGGGVTRACQHPCRYCPYTDCRQPGCSRPQTKSINGSHLVEWANGLSSVNSLTSRAPFLDCGYGASTIDRPHPHFWSFLSKEDSSAIQQISNIKCLNTKSYRHPVGTIAHQPWTPASKTHTPDNFKPGVSTRRHNSLMFDYHSPGQMTRSERLWTRQPEHGQVFLMESPNHNESKNGSVNIRHRVAYSTEFGDCKAVPFQNHAHQQFKVRDAKSTPTPCAFSTCRETESACRIAASRADSDTSRSRLLPMRPEIKSTDITNDDAQLKELSKLILECNNEQKTPSYSPLSLSVSRTRQAKQAFGWTDSDDLFQVSDVAETDTKSGSVTIEQTCSSLSYRYHLGDEIKTETIPDADQHSGGFTSMGIGQTFSYNHKPIQTFLQKGIKDRDFLNKPTDSQGPLNVTCNKSPQNPLVGFFELPQIGRNTHLENAGADIPEENKTRTESQNFSIQGEQRAGNSIRPSRFEVTENYGNLKMKAAENKSRSTRKSGITSVENLSYMNSLALPNSETDSDRTPSLGFVSRIVNAYRQKFNSNKAIASSIQTDSLYTWSPENPKVEAVRQMTRARSNLNAVQNQRGHEVDWTRLDNNTSIKEFQSGERLLSPESSVSSFVTSFSCSENRLSLFRELTIAKGSEYSSPLLNTQIIRGNRIDVLENALEDNCLQDMDNAKSVSVQKYNSLGKSQLDQVALDNLETKTLRSTMTNYPQTSLSFRGSQSPNTPRVEFSSGFYKSSISPTENARNTSSFRTESTFRTGSSRATKNTTYARSTSVRSPQAPYSYDDGILKNALSCIPEPSKTTTKSVSNLCDARGKILTDFSHRRRVSKAKKPPPSTNSPATLRSWGTFNSSLTSTENRFSLLTPHSFQGQLSAKSNLSSPAISERKTSPAEKTKRLHSKNNTRMSRAFSNKKGSPKTQRSGDFSPKRVQERNVHNDRVQSQTKQKNPMIYPQETSPVHINKLKYAGKVGRYDTFEEVSPQVRKSLPAYRSIKKGSTYEVERSNGDLSKTPKSKIAMSAANDKISNKQKNKASCKVTNFERSQLEIKNNMLSFSGPSQQNTGTQSSSIGRQQTILGCHASPKISPGQFKRQKAYFTPKTKKAPKIPKHIAENMKIKSQQNNHGTHQPKNTLSKLKSLDKPNNWDQSSQRSPKLHTPEVVDEVEPKHFQLLKPQDQRQNQTDHKTLQKPVSSLNGLFHISPSVSPGSWFKGSPTNLSPSPRQHSTYKMTSISPLRSSAQSVGSSTKRNSVTHSDEFLCSRFFTACNSTSDKTTRKSASGKSKDFVNKEGNRCVSYLEHEDDAARRKRLSQVFEKNKECGNTSSRQPLPLKVSRSRSRDIMNETPKTTEKSWKEEHQLSSASMRKEKNKASGVRKIAKSKFPLIHNKHNIRANNEKSEQSKSQSRDFAKQRRVLSEPKTADLFTASTGKDGTAGNRKVRQQSGHKTPQFKASFGSTSVASHALSTNNSATVFPRDILRRWGHIKFSDHMLVLRLPVSFLGLSDGRMEYRPRSLVPGLRGEGDGCAAVNQASLNEDASDAQHMNLHPPQCQGASSIDWYKPAARTQRRRASLQRRCRLFPSNTDQSHLTNAHLVTSSPFTGESLTLPTNSTVSANRGHASSASGQGLCHGFGTYSNTSKSEHKQFEGIRGGSHQEANSSNCRTVRLHAIKSLSCSNIHEKYCSQTPCIALLSQETLVQTAPGTYEKSLHISPYL